MDRLIGTGVALVTPFDEQQRIDRESLYRLVNYVIDGGVDFLVALGTTAETATLSADERAVVVHTILEANQGRLPVIAGIGGNNTAEVIRELQTATWLKACQGILSITPCYNKPTQRGLYIHFFRCCRRDIYDCRRNDPLQHRFLLLIHKASLHSGNTFPEKKDIGKCAGTAHLPISFYFVLLCITQSDFILLKSSF